MKYLNKSRIIIFITEMKQKTWILHRRNWDNYDHMKKKDQNTFTFQKNAN